MPSVHAHVKHLPLIPKQTLGKLGTLTFWRCSPAGGPFAGGPPPRAGLAVRARLRKHMATVRRPHGIIHHDMDAEWNRAPRILALAVASLRKAAARCSWVCTSRSSASVARVASLALSDCMGKRAAHTARA